MPLSRHRRDWEDLAVLDPLWAVSGKRATSDSPWTVSDFLATGEVEIEAVLGQAARLERPRRQQRALDFGCGLGRVTQAGQRRLTSSIPASFFSTCRPAASPPTTSASSFALQERMDLSS